jgi:hypothetical protein
MDDFLTRLLDSHKSQSRNALSAPWQVEENARALRSQMGWSSD